MTVETIEETQATGEDFTVPTHVKCNSCSWTKPNGDPTPCPEGHVSGFTRADDEEPEATPSLAEEMVAGLSDVCDEIEDARSAKQKLEDAERAEQIEEAIVEVCSIQEQLEQAVRDEAAAIQEKKEATQLVDSLDSQLRGASMRLRKLREGRFPDGDKYPMFDKAKAEINLAFPAPEAIQPLPPDTFAEALRRKQRDTPLLSMGFKASTLKVLTEKHGLKTALDLVNKVTEYGQRNMDFTRADGITELRFGEIADKLEELTGECEAGWKAAHAEPDEKEQALIRETFAALVSVGHTQEQANAMVKRAWDSGQKFASVSEAVDAIYLASQQDEEGGDE